MPSSRSGRQTALTTLREQRSVLASNCEKMAEGKGFEPPKGISSFNDLANRRLQPLGHPSAGAGPCGCARTLGTGRRYTAYADACPSFECAVCQTGIQCRWDKPCGGVDTSRTAGREQAQNRRGQPQRTVINAVVRAAGQSRITRRVWLATAG